MDDFLDWTNHVEQHADQSKHDFVVLLNKTSGKMRCMYLMIDNHHGRICAKTNLVTWPRLNDWSEYRACVLKNCIYVIGGKETSTGRFQKQMLKFDPKSNRWMEMACMKRARVGHTATVFNGKIYVIGGSIQANDMTSTCESYEPFLDEWQDEESMPGARKDHACVVKDNAIYLSGGVSSTTGASDNIWVFRRVLMEDKSKKKEDDDSPPKPPKFVFKWTQLEDEGQTKMTFKITNHISVLHQEKLFFLGGICYGYSQDGKNFCIKKTSDSKRLNATSNLIESYKCAIKLIKPHIQEPHHHFRPQHDLPPPEKKVYRRGEMRNQTRLNHKSQEEEERLAKQEVHQRKAVWVPDLARMPTARCCATGIVLGSRIFVFGGHRIEDEESTGFSDVDCYDMKKNVWSTAFSLGKGDFRDLDCCVISVPKENRDFKPTAYGDCRWVMW